MLSIHYEITELKFFCVHKNIHKQWPLCRNICFCSHFPHTEFYLPCSGLWMLKVVNKVTFGYEILPELS